MKGRTPPASHRPASATPSELASIPFTVPLQGAYRALRRGLVVLFCFALVLTTTDVAIVFVAAQPMGPSAALPWSATVSGPAAPSPAEGVDVLVNPRPGASRQVRREWALFGRIVASTFAITALMVLKAALLPYYFQRQARLLDRPIATAPRRFARTAGTLFLNALASATALVGATIPGGLVLFAAQLAHFSMLARASTYFAAIGALGRRRVRCHGPAPRRACVRAGGFVSRRGLRTELAVDAATSLERSFVPLLLALSLLQIVGFGGIFVLFGAGLALVPLARAFRRRRIDAAVLRPGRRGAGQPASHRAPAPMSVPPELHDIPHDWRELASFTGLARTHGLTFVPRDTHELALACSPGRGRPSSRITFLAPADTPSTSSRCPPTSCVTVGRTWPCRCAPSTALPSIPGAAS